MTQFIILSQESFKNRASVQNLMQKNQHNLWQTTKCAKPRCRNCIL